MNVREFSIVLGRAMAIFCLISAIRMVQPLVVSFLTPDFSWTRDSFPSRAFIGTAIGTFTAYLVLATALWTGVARLDFGTNDPGRTTLDGRVMIALGMRLLGIFLFVLALSRLAETVIQNIFLTRIDSDAAKRVAYAGIASEVIQGLIGLGIFLFNRIDSPERSQP